MNNIDAPHIYNPYTINAKNIIMVDVINITNKHFNNSKIYLTINF